MKNICRICLLLALPVLAQSQGQSIASTMDVYVFPAQGQEASQQSKDEAECYEWAVGNTGVDPFQLADQEQANQQQAQAEQEAAKQAGPGRCSERCCTRRSPGSGYRRDRQ